MRIYIWIAGTASVLFGLVLAIGIVLRPDFVGSAQFYDSILIEALSFIVTTAVIGSVSAAVVSYMQDKKMEPVRHHGASRLAECTKSLLSYYLDFLSDGHPRTPYIEDKIATLEYVIPKYEAEYPLHYELTKDRLYFHFDRMRETVTDFMQFMPIEAQDECHFILDALFQRKFMIDRVEEDLLGYVVESPDIVLPTVSWSVIARQLRSLGNIKALGPSTEVFGELSSWVESRPEFTNEVRLTYGRFLNTPEGREWIGGLPNDCLLSGLHSGTIQDFSVPHPDQDQILGRVDKRILGLSEEGMVDLIGLGRRDVDRDGLFAALEDYREANGLPPLDHKRFAFMLDFDPANPMGMSS